MKHIYIFWDKGHEREAQWCFVKDNEVHSIPGWMWKHRRRLGLIKSWIFLFQIGVSQFIDRLMSR